MSLMKFLIIGDLHGNKPNVYSKDFDAIIAPGDFCSSEARKYMFQAMKENMKNPDSKLEWYGIIGKRKARAEVKKSLRDGRKILEFLNSFNVPIYIVPGNYDWTGFKDENWKFLQENHYKKLIRGLDNLVDVYHRIVDIGDYQIIGNGISSGPEYPQYAEDRKRLTPKELKQRKRDYEKTLKKISALFEKAKRPVIYLSHNVPFNTALDKIQNKESPRNGHHFGSVIGRNVIIKYKPLVSIGGHMHEYHKSCKLGKTVCIDAGFGSYVNTFLELEGNRIKRLKFYKGK